MYVRIALAECVADLALSSHRWENKETERERETETERDWETERDGERETERDRERDEERERQRETERDWERDEERERQRETERDKGEGRAVALSFLFCRFLELAQLHVNQETSDESSTVHYQVSD